MKKVIVFILFVMVCTVTITMAAFSCKVEETDSGNTSMFVQVEKTNQWRIVYHRETKVMYAVSRGAKGVFTTLVNADGTPMTYRDGKDIPRVAP